MSRNFAADFLAFTGSSEPGGLSEKLKEYWTKPVAELCHLAEPTPGPRDQERHRIYALMLMALLHEYWNGNKRGRGAKFRYPWNDFDTPGPHLDDDYRGHNIAAIAVNGDGNILDFDFNHNRLFNSSAEHAETRLVRRAFALAQLPDTWRPLDTSPDHEPLTDYTMLEDVTIYTSLESCAQCAGVMALGRVSQIVYLQTDPGMYFIGRILRNLTEDKLRAPLPITGTQIGLPYFEELDNAFGDFAEAVKDRPFCIESDDDGNVIKTDAEKSVTSFLCTQSARSIFGAARTEFEELTSGKRGLEFPDYRPKPTAKSNRDVVREAEDFLAYATTSGRRATPHH
jgi:tRNA(Arg) A34 adenosine deaminase TadA